MQAEIATRSNGFKRMDDGGIIDGGIIWMSQRREFRRPLD